MGSREYLLKHSQKLSAEYQGKYLAILDERVVAVSSSVHDTFEKKIYVRERNVINLFHT